MKTQKIDLEEILRNTGSVAIGGHVNPDGDCIGACTALFLYILRYHPDIKADLYLEDYLPVFEKYIPVLKKCRKEYDGGDYDLVVILDVSTTARIGVIGNLFEKTERTVCIDHHRSNTGIGGICRIEPDTGSTCEVLFKIMDRDRIDSDIAASLYTGIVHDTGVFQYSSTSPETLESAAFLMEKGIDFTGIIEDSFYKRSYVQSRIIGKVLDGSKLYFGGKCIVGTLDADTIRRYGAEKKDLGAVVSQLRLTEGTDIAVFAYEFTEGNTKVSFRSNGDVCVDKIAVKLGGGGHYKAAGADVSLPLEDAVEKVTALIGKELYGI